jgi:hypothetical protein
MIAPGVFAGAESPYHCEVSKPAKPCSAIVGASGIEVRRFGEPTPITRSLPALTCGMSGGVPAEVACVRPATRSTRFGPVPLYGTC